MSQNSSETEQFLRQLASGDHACWGALLARHRERLRRMVLMRMDRRLNGRIDPSDVIQETYLEASRRLDAYVREPSMPIFLWLRFLARQKLLELHRHHLGAKARDAARDVSLFDGLLPQASSEALAAQLLGHLTHPSEAAMRAELQLRVQDALERLDPGDREVLTLRHFERLDNTEVAHVLGLNKSAASKRYLRALKRLKEILAQTPGIL